MVERGPGAHLRPKCGWRRDGSGFGEHERCCRAAVTAAARPPTKLGEQRVDKRRVDLPRGLVGVLGCSRGRRSKRRASSPWRHQWRGGEAWSRARRRGDTWFIWWTGQPLCKVFAIIAPNSILCLAVAENPFLIALISLAAFH
jgi:hypothetical protein